MNPSETRLLPAAIRYPVLFVLFAFVAIVLMGMIRDSHSRPVSRQELKELNAKAIRNQQMDRINSALNEVALPSREEVAGSFPVANSREVMMEQARKRVAEINEQLESLRSAAGR